MPVPSSQNGMMFVVPKVRNSKQIFIKYNFEFLTELCARKQKLVGTYSAAPKFVFCPKNKDSYVQRSLIALCYIKDAISDVIPRTQYLISKYFGRGGGCGNSNCPSGEGDTLIFSSELL